MYSLQPYTCLTYVITKNTGTATRLHRLLACNILLLH